MKEEKEYFLCIVAIFKNEALILEEWLNHYINQGVEHFYLIDNGSTDNYKNILLKFNNVTCITDDEKYKQVEHYNKYLSTIKSSSEWVIVVDLDEFIYARNGFNSIKSVLLTIDCDVISIGWKMFGSSNHIEQPLSVRTGFTYRLKGVSLRQNNKEIIRTSVLDKFTSAHEQLTSGKKIVMPNKSYDEESSKDSSYDEESLKDCVLHLNHYAIQSKSFFEKIKMTRGDVAAARLKNIRNWDYFNAYDHKEILDEELKNIVKMAEENEEKTDVTDEVEVKDDSDD